MMRACEHRLRWTDLHEPAKVEHGDAVGYIVHDVQIVRDENVAHLLLGLQIDQQIEDCGLHGNVERRCRLVAHHQPRAAGKSAGDADPLFQAAGELPRLFIEMPLGQTHGGCELAQPRLSRSPIQSNQAQRTPDQPAHGLRAIQRRAWILKHDLQRLELRQSPIVGARRQRLAGQIQPAPGVGRC